MAQHHWYRSVFTSVILIHCAMFYSSVHAQSFDATGPAQPNPSTWGQVDVRFDKIPGVKLRFNGEGTYFESEPLNAPVSFGYLETYDPDNLGGDAFLSWETVGDVAEQRFNRVWIDTENPARIKVIFHGALVLQEGNDNIGKRIAHADKWSGSPIYTAEPWLTLQGQEIVPQQYGDWVEEIYYIYPDGTHTRYSIVYSAHAHEAIAFGGNRIPPNYNFEFTELWVNFHPLKPTDLVDNDQSLFLADLNGQSSWIDYVELGNQNQNPGCVSPPDAALASGYGSLSNGNMMMLNVSQSNNNPFIIAKPENITLQPYECFCNEPELGGQYESCESFVTWPNTALGEPVPNGVLFPIGHIINDETYERQRANQVSNVPGVLSNIYLHGWEGDDVTGSQMAELGNSWWNAPDMQITSSGFSFGSVVDRKQHALLPANGYSVVERAYKVKKTTGSDFTCTLQAGSGNPVRNPAFVIEDWGTSIPATNEITANGSTPADVRMGLEGNNLIVWMEYNSTSPVAISIGGDGTDPCTGTPPPSPTDVSVSESNCVSTITWNAPDCADDYTLQRSVNGGSYSDLSTSLTGTSYTDNGVSYGNSYQYRVRAQNDGLHSSFATSNTITASCGQPPQGELSAYYTRNSYNEYTSQISGEYADVVVKVGDLGQLEFSREYSFRPNWVYNGGSERVNHLASINGDGPTFGNFDSRCRYAYARIIQNNSSQVIVHWRYFPDLDDLDPAAVVHELYYIHSDGSVTREYKAGTASIDEWLDVNNKTTQTFNLTASGISNVQAIAGSFSPPARIAGNPVLGPVAGDPATNWNFDEGQGNNAAPNGTINGHKSLWKKGVSGTALGFDGYFSNVSVSSAQAPTLGSSFTIDTWIVLGAYPVNEVPIVHHSEHTGSSGYYLGVNAAGKAILKVNGTAAVSSDPLPLNQWVHIAGAYGSGSMEVYINGVQQGSASKSGTPDKPGGDLLIGLNNSPAEASDPVRPTHNHPYIFGFEGLVDEVKIYNSKLSSGEIQTSYDSFKPDSTIINNPSIHYRVLPGQPGTAASFGASHTRLPFHDLWDNMWRTVPFEDVVVKFDKLPTNYVYWRGTTHGVNMVTENNFWMSDQSVEIYCGDSPFPPNPSGVNGLSEHMSDKEARYSHVRVIENTPARVVVHWRYGVVDLMYDQCDPRNFVDEYHTIYPDGALLRTTYFWTTNEEITYSDFQGLTPSGLTASDVVNLQAASLANTSGSVENLTWTGSNGVPGGEDEILMANYKSDWKPFQGYTSGALTGPWGADEQSPNTSDPFAGPWNHWPVSRMVSDGRYATDGDGRVNSFALTAGGGGNVILYGFSNQGSITSQNVADVIPIVKAWRSNPGISNVSGGSSQGYNIKKREYNLIMSDALLSFTLNGSSNNPLINPCFVIKNWGDRKTATLEMNGSSTSNFSQGLIYDTDGTETMVIYVPMNAAASQSFTVGKGSVPNTYALTTGTAGSGTGSVSTLRGSYEEGSVVTLTATPSDSSAFTGWSGDLSGSTNPANVTMNGHKHITANFTSAGTIQYTLSTGTAGAGAGNILVSPPGETFYDGSVVTITAIPSANSDFTGWSGDLSGASNPANVSMNYSKHVTANFTSGGPAQYTLSASTSGPGTGHISLSPSGGTYDEGTVVSVAASPTGGSTFAGWSGDLSGSTNPTAITMNNNKSVNAIFNAGGGTGRWIKVNDNDNAATYSGTWDSVSAPGGYQDDAHFTASSGASVSFAFTGTQVRLYLWKEEFAQRVSVSIDGGSSSNVNQSGGGSGTSVQVYESNVLSNGNHTLLVSYGSGEVHIDAFEYYPDQSTSTVISENNSANLIINPNPVNDIIGLQLSGIEGNAQISIVNSKGIEVFSDRLKVFEDFQTEISAIHLVDGVYTMRITSDNHTYVKQFVVIK